MHNISVQAHKQQQMIKALTATGWDKQKERLMATYKTGSGVCLFHMITSYIIDQHYQIVSHAVLRTVTGCAQDTNIQHLHDITFILPKHEYLHSYRSMCHSRNLKHNIHHIPYINFNIPRLEKHYLQQQPLHNKHSHSHHNRHKIKHVPYTYIYISMHLATRGNNTIHAHISSSEEILS